jgi:CubicO group peptidase (beta-lactamase class C family)
MIRILFTLIGIVSFMASCRQPAQLIPEVVLTSGSPEAGGMAPDRLGRISKMLEQAVSDGEIPGGVALIARNGKVVYHHAFGMSDVRDNQPFSKDAVFRIASQTKAITATAVMMLWEEGRFRLDDPISRYIPEFSEPSVIMGFVEEDTTYTAEPAGKEITIRHLLTHTSGIGYGVIDSDPRFRKIYNKARITDLFTTEDISIGASVRKLAGLPLHHKPGEKFTYSEGLDVLGYLIEVITGKPFDSFLRERIFDPLGMNDTWFYLPESKASRLVPVQHLKEGQWEQYPVTFYDPDYPIKGAKRFLSGGAGLSSTARDYAVFLQMFLNKGEYNGIRLLSRTTVETMMANQIGDLWAGGPKHYGLAFGVVNPDGIAFGGEGGLGTFDWGGYFNTQYFADPGEQLIGILMKQTQGTASDQTGWKFRQMTFAAIDD